MKNLVVALLLAFIVLGVYSCKKPAKAPQGNSAPTIMGRWSLVSDSSIFEPVGSASENSIYMGMPVDCFDFEANGKLAWTEQSVVSDSSKYTLSADNKLITLHYYIANVPQATCDCTQSFEITLLTANKMILTQPPTPTPAGIIIGKIITLSK